MKQRFIPWQALAIVVIVGAGAVAGCARNAEVDTLQQRVQRLETRSPQVVKLEQRVASLEAAARRIEALIGALDARAGAPEQAGEPSGMDSRLESLMRRLDDLERKVASAGAAPRVPPRAHNRPDPDAIYSLPVAGSPVRGSRDARVTMIRSYEFACPFCERSRATMDQLLKHYGKDLRIVYKHFIVHPHVATEPARAACAAQQQGRFFDMERAIWDRGFLANRDLSVANMENIARDLGLNMKKFRRDMNSAACDQQIRDDQALLKQVGATGTPAFFINGRFLSGARPVDQFKVVIDEELARADRVMREQKINKRDYYEYVVKTGKKSL